MKILLSSVLLLALSLTISCSNGGSDSKSNPNPNPAGTPGPATDPNTIPANGAGQLAAGVDKGILGTWESGGIKLEITANTIQLSGVCANGQKIQVVSQVTISNTTITVQEDKVSGQGECEIKLKKGEVIPYTLNGNTLVTESDNEKRPFTRVAAAGNPTPNQTPAPADPGQAEGTIEIFSNVNCQGNKTVVSINTNCATTNGNVSSLRVAGQGCQNTQSVMTARSVCEAIFQQLGGQ